MALELETDARSAGQRAYEAALASLGGAAAPGGMSPPPGAAFRPTFEIPQSPVSKSLSEIPAEEAVPSIRKRLLQAKRAVLEGSYDRGDDGFWQQVQTQLRRGSIQDDLNDAHKTAAKLVSSDPQNPDYRNAYQMVRQVQDVFDKYRSENPVEAEGPAGLRLVKDMLLQGAESLPVMGKALVWDLLPWALAALEPTPFGEVGAAALTARKGTRIGRAIYSAGKAGGMRGAVAKGVGAIGKAGAAVRGSENLTVAWRSGVMLQNFFPEHYSEAYKKMVDAGTDPRVANAYANWAGILSSLVEGVIGPGRLLGIEQGGVLTDQASKALHKAIKGPFWSAITKWGLDRVTGFLGEWLEEGAQGGLNNLIAYLGVQSQRDPELTRALIADVTQEINKPEMQGLEGWREIRDGWDIFLRSAQKNLEESWKGVGGLAIMGVPFQAPGRIASAARTKGLEKQAGAFDVNTSQIRQATETEPEYQERLATIVKGMSEIRAVEDRTARETEATEKEAAKKAEAEKRAALTIDERIDALTPEEQEIVADAGDIAYSANRLKQDDAKDRLLELRAVLGKVFDTPDAVDLYIDDQQTEFADTVARAEVRSNDYTLSRLASEETQRDQAFAGYAPKDQATVLKELLDEEFQGGHDFSKAGIMRWLTTGTYAKQDGVGPSAEGKTQREKIREAYAARAKEAADKKEKADAALEQDRTMVRQWEEGVKDENRQPGTTLLLEDGAEVDYAQVEAARSRIAKAEGVKPEEKAQEAKTRSQDLRQQAAEAKAKADKLPESATIIVKGEPQPAKAFWSKRAHTLGVQAAEQERIEEEKTWEFPYEKQESVYNDKTGGQWTLVGASKPSGVSPSDNSRRTVTLQNKAGQQITITTAELERDYARIGERRETGPEGVFSKEFQRRELPETGKYDVWDDQGNQGRVVATALDPNTGVVYDVVHRPDIGEDETVHVGDLWKDTPPEARTPAAPKTPTLVELHAELARKQTEWEKAKTGRKRDEIAEDMESLQRTLESEQARINANRRDEKQVQSLKQYTDADGDVVPVRVLEQVYEGLPDADEKTVQELDDYISDPETGQRDQAIAVALATTRLERLVPGAVATGRNFVQPGARFFLSGAWGDQPGMRLPDGTVIRKPRRVLRARGGMEPERRVTPANITLRDKQGEVVFEGPLAEAREIAARWNRYEQAYHKTVERKLHNPRHKRFFGVVGMVAEQLASLKRVRSLVHEQRRTVVLSPAGAKRKAAAELRERAAEIRSEVSAARKQWVAADRRQRAWLKAMVPKAGGVTLMRETQPTIDAFNGIEKALAAAGLSFKKAQALEVQADRLAAKGRVTEERRVKAAEERAAAVGRLDTELEALDKEIAYARTQLFAAIKIGPQASRRVAELRDVEAQFNEEVAKLGKAAKPDARITLRVPRVSDRKAVKAGVGEDRAGIQPTDRTNRTRTIADWKAYIAEFRKEVSAIRRKETREERSGKRLPSPQMEALAASIADRDTIFLEAKVLMEILGSRAEVEGERIRPGVAGDLDVLPAWKVEQTIRDVVKTGVGGESPGDTRDRVRKNVWNAIHSTLRGYNVAIWETLQDEGLEGAPEEVETTEAAPPQAVEEEELTAAHEEAAETLEQDELTEGERRAQAAPVETPEASDEDVSRAREFLGVKERATPTPAPDPTLVDTDVAAAVRQLGTMRSRPDERIQDREAWVIWNTAKEVAEREHAEARAEGRAGLWETDPRTGFATETGKKDMLARILAIADRKDVQLVAVRSLEASEKAAMQEREQRRLGAAPQDVREIEGDGGRSPSVQAELDALGVVRVVEHKPGQMQHQQGDRGHAVEAGIKVRDGKVINEFEIGINSDPAVQVHELGHIVWRNRPDIQEFWRMKWPALRGRMRKGLDTKIAQEEAFNDLLEWRAMGILDQKVEVPDSVKRLLDQVLDEHPILRRVAAGELLKPDRPSPLTLRPDGTLRGVEPQRSPIEQAQAAVDKAGTMAEKQRVLYEWKAQNPEAVREIEGTSISMDDIRQMRSAYRRQSDGLVFVSKGPQEGHIPFAERLGLTPIDLKRNREGAGKDSKSWLGPWSIAGHDYGLADTSGRFYTMPELDAALQRKPSPLTLRPDGTLAGIVSVEKARKGTAPKRGRAPEELAKQRTLDIYRHRQLRDEALARARGYWRKLQTLAGRAGRALVGLSTDAVQQRMDAADKEIARIRDTVEEVKRLRRVEDLAFKMSAEKTARQDIDWAGRRISALGLKLTDPERAKLRKELKLLGVRPLDRVVKKGDTRVVERSEERKKKRQIEPSKEQRELIMGEIRRIHAEREEARQRLKEAEPEKSLESVGSRAVADVRRAANAILAVASRTSGLTQDMLEALEEYRRVSTMKAEMETEAEAEIPAVIARLEVRLSDLEAKRDAAEAKGNADRAADLGKEAARVETMIAEHREAAGLGEERSERELRAEERAPYTAMQLAARLIRQYRVFLLSGLEQGEIPASRSVEVEGSFEQRKVSREDVRTARPISSVVRAIRENSPDQDAIINRYKESVAGRPLTEDEARETTRRLAELAQRWHLRRALEEERDLGEILAERGARPEMKAYQAAVQLQPMALRTTSVSLGRGVQGRVMYQDPDLAYGREATPRELERILNRDLGIKARVPLEGGTIFDGRIGVFRVIILAERTRETAGSRAELGVEPGTIVLTYNLDSLRLSTPRHELRHIGIAGLSTPNLNILARHLGIDTSKDRVALEEAVDSRLDEVEPTLAKATPRMRAIWRWVKEMAAKIADVFGVADENRPEWMRAAKSANQPGNYIRRDVGALLRRQVLTGAATRAVLEGQAEIVEPGVRMKPPPGFSGPFYHGSPTAFGEFQDSATGIYFSSARDKDTVPVLRAGDKGVVRPYFLRLGKSFHVDTGMQTSKKDWLSADSIRQLKAQGYDSIIYQAEEIPGQGVEYIVFSKDQIISAARARHQAPLSDVALLKSLGPTAYDDWVGAGRPGTFATWAREQEGRIAAEQKAARLEKKYPTYQRYRDDTLELIDRDGAGQTETGVARRQSGVRGVWNRVRRGLKGVHFAQLLPTDYMDLLSRDLGKRTVRERTEMNATYGRILNETMGELRDTAPAIDRSRRYSFTWRPGLSAENRTFGEVLTILWQLMAAKADTGKMVAKELREGGFAFEGEEDKESRRFKVKDVEELDSLIAKISALDPNLRAEIERMTPIMDRLSEHVKPVFDEVYPNMQWKKRDFYLHIMRAAHEETKINRGQRQAIKDAKTGSYQRETLGAMGLMRMLDAADATEVKQLTGAGDAPILARDAYRIVAKTVNDLAKFTAAARYSKQMRALTKDQRFVDKVAAVMGNRQLAKNFIDNMDRDIESLGGTIPSEDAFSGFIGKIINRTLSNSAVAFLSDPFVSMKQFASFANYATYFGSDVWRRAATSRMDPEEYRQVFDRTGVIRFRGQGRGGGYSNIFESSSSEGMERQILPVAGAGDAFAWAREHGMALTRAMDRLTTRRAIHMAQLAVDKTWTGEKTSDYYQAVADEADRATVATQVQTTDFNRSNLQRNKNPFARGFTFMRGARSISGSALIAGVMKVGQAWDRYHNALADQDQAEIDRAKAEVSANAANLLQQFMFQGVLQQSIIEGIQRGKWAAITALLAGLGLGGDDDEDEEPAIAKAFDFLGGVGRGITSLPAGLSVPAAMVEAFTGSKGQLQARRRVASEFAPALAFPMDIMDFGVETSKVRKYQRELESGVTERGQQLSSSGRRQRLVYLKKAYARQIERGSTVLFQWIGGVPFSRTVIQLASKARREYVEKNP